MNGIFGAAGFVLPLAIIDAWNAACCAMNAANAAGLGLPPIGFAKIGRLFEEGAMGAGANRGLTTSPLLPETCAMQVSESMVSPSPPYTPPFTTFLFFAGGLAWWGGEAV